MFSKLGQFVARRPLIVVAVWIAIVIGLRLAAPPWDQVTHDGDSGQLPDTMTSVQAAARLTEAFPAEKAQSECVVVVASLVDRIRFEEPRSPDEEADFSAIRDLNRKLRDRFAEHEFVVAYWPPVDPQATEEQVFADHLRSPDRWAAAILIKTNRDFSAVALTDFVRQLNAEVEKITQAPGFPANRLLVSVTGSAAIGSDILTSAAESLRRTEVVTIILVLIILLAVYRAPVLVVIPLVTIGASVVASTDLLAIAANFSTEHGSDWFDFKIFTTTRIFIVVILVGAGTDFCLFLFARFREALRSGQDPDTATVAALSGVGNALLGSALTTIVGLGMLFFSEFGKFRNSGPALGICMFVALVASVTLAPALLRLTGRFVFWPFGNSESNNSAESSRSVGRFSRIWKAIGQRIVARPGLVLLATVLVLSPLAWSGTNVRTTFDLLSELDRDRASVRGAKMLNRHFPPGEGSPITIVATLPEPLAISEQGFSPGVGPLRSMTQYLEMQPGVRGVRSFASPLGEPIARFGVFSGAELMTARRKTAAHYLSPVDPWTNRVARFEVIGGYAPFSDESRALLADIRENLERIAAGMPAAMPQPSESAGQTSADAEDQAATGAPPTQSESQNAVELAPDWEQGWEGAEFDFAGATAASSDLQEVVTRDTLRIKILSAVAVFLVLLVVLRRPVISVFLILSVIFSFLVTIGATQLVFSVAYGNEFVGLDWKVPIFLFVILVAIGEDYNIYLVTRVLEEQRRLGPMAGLREAVAKTGGIISSCGVIMAGTFVSMMSGTLRGMLELGFALSLGVLLDTFIVRPVLVPAFLALLERFRQRRDLSWMQR